MTATLRPKGRQNFAVDTAAEVITAPETTAQRWTRYVAATTRLSLGFTFLWAFLDKTFALGFATGVRFELPTV